MDQTINIPSKHTGRPYGKGNLSEEVKLGIVQEKKLQLMSQSKIAEQFDVARFTVNRITEDDLAPETKIKLATFESQLEKARNKVIQRINEKLDNNDFKDGVYPNLLNAVNTNYRLETNQSTSNITVLDVVKSVQTTLDYVLELHHANPTKHPLPTKQMILDSYESSCRSNGVQPDFDAIDLSVLDGGLPLDQDTSSL